MITSVVTFLNYLLSRTETSVTYWSDAYLPSVFSKFPELDSAARLRLQSLGATRGHRVPLWPEAAADGSEEMFKDAYPFTETNVVDLPYRVKLLMPPVLHARGEMLWEEG